MTTIDEAKARLERNARLEADGVCYVAIDDLRTLLAHTADYDALKGRLSRRPPVASPPASAEEIAGKIAIRWAEPGTFFQLAAEIEAALLSDRVAMREEVAAWMIRHSFATGHGDTLADLLGELSAGVERERSDRAAMAERVAGLERHCITLERQRDEANVYGDEEHARFEASEAEVARLREALGVIADNCSAFMLSSDPGDIIPAKCGIIARAALTRHEPTKET